jgi:hypothetical protein
MAASAEGTHIRRDDTLPPPLLVFPLLLAVKGRRCDDSVTFLQSSRIMEPAGVAAAESGIFWTC